MKKLKSEGKCVYCEKMFAGAGIGRHLTTHLKALEKESLSKSTSYHLKIPAGKMFLHVLIDGSAQLKDLDTFLRQIWLECCGHLSGFQVKGKHYDWDEDDFGEKMTKKVSSIFVKGMKIEYDYDFGSTTRLELQVVNEYSLKVPSKILLLSRNEPLPILCHVCEQKPAKEICTVHIYEGASMFCASCAKKHAKKCEDFADYAAITVVNSPRMGVCAYEGGGIDTERDGIWKG